MNQSDLTSSSRWSLRKPTVRTHSELIIWIFLIGLSLHTLVMSILLGDLNVPSHVITALSSWKELLAGFFAGALLLTVRHRWFRGYKSLTSVDWFVLLFAIWIAAQTAWLFIMHGYLVPKIAILYGLRFYFVPILLYVIGRLGRYTRFAVRRLYWGLAVVGGISGFIAIVERLIPTPVFINLLDALGYHTYFSNYVNSGALYGPYDTSASMWQRIGQQYIRRAGSIFLVSKPFALIYVVIIPATLFLAAAERNARHKRIATILLALSWAGVTLSVTREVIGVCVLLLIGMLFWLKSWRIGLPALSGIAIAALAIMIAFSPLEHGDPKVATLSSQVSTTGAMQGGSNTGGSNTGTPQGGSNSGASQQLNKFIETVVRDPSLREHLQVWTSAISVSLERPIEGWGVGAANEDSQRFIQSGTLPVTLGTEDVFLQVLEELGLVGLLLYLGIFVSLIRISLRSNRSRSMKDSGLAVIAFWAVVGVSIAGLSTPLWTGAFVVTYAFWWLAGLTVARSEQALGGHMQNLDEGVWGIPVSRGTSDIDTAIVPTLFVPRQPN